MEGHSEAKPSKSRPAEIMADPHPLEPGPVVFEMDAGDTSSEEASAAGTPESKRNQLKKALEKAKTSSAAPAAGGKKQSPAGSGPNPGLSADELADYERIEAQFKAFRTRQVDLESSVATLLSRLNTQVKIPSSVASSEAGDLTSMASSEWDTESCGLTEDGLSILGSHAGTPPGGSPRADASVDRLPPLQRVMQRRDAPSAQGPLSWAELQE
eukprot:2488494-Amphidinium_carterae.1